VLEGQSRAKFPIVDNNNQVTGIMKTFWTQSCEMTMHGDSTEQ